MNREVKKIRNEIERRIAYHEEWFNPDSEGKDDLLEENKELLSFIDSLQEEPVREKELTESYLAVFEKKYPVMPTLKGKQLADFKNFLNKCQQEFGLKEYGIHPTQAKLFEKLALLWATWGAEHLQDIGKNVDGEQDEEPVSEELEEEIKKLIYDVLFDLDGVAIKGISEYIKVDDIAFLARYFAEWGKNHIVNNNEMISEELEKAADEWNGSLYRSDAFIAGANWQKQQMMNSAIEREVKVDAGGYPYIDATELYDYENDKPLAKAGDRVKVVFIKDK